MENEKLKQTPIEIGTSEHDDIPDDEIIIKNHQFSERFLKNMEHLCAIVRLYSKYGLFDQIENDKEETYDELNILK